MNIIDCDGVSFKRGKRQVLKSFSLQVQEGEFVALIGHNGAGKSTLIKLLLGLLRPERGKILVLGTKPGTEPAKIGYLPENVSFYDGMTFQENLRYFAELKSVPAQRVEELLNSLGLSSVAAQKLAHCSKGQKQRLGLAQALLGEPKLLFLDEPTVGLDPMASDFMYRELLKLKKKGCTVIVCTHELSLVEGFIDRAVIVSSGNKVADGSIPELSKKLDLFFELVSSFAVKAAKTDPNLSEGVIADHLYSKSSHLAGTLDYLQSRYGITDIDVRPPSLLEIYKAALENKEKK